MVVQHNLQAMNSNRMLGITTSSQAKVTEKLSSGYKINRAADDAAGLSISEKMRKQIRGLDQASNNAQDGVSAVQTAEGALAEVHDMLQRMNELAVQAANGTNSETDRDAIQNEIEQLTTEIDRVAETTKFNETYLLKGGEGTKTETLKLHDAGLKGTLENGKFVMDELKAGDQTKIGGKEYNIGEVGAAINTKFTAAVATLKAGDTLKVGDVTYTYYAEKPKNTTTGSESDGWKAGWYASAPVDKGNGTGDQLEGTPINETFFNKLDDGTKIEANFDQAGKSFSTYKATANEIGTDGKTVTAEKAYDLAKAELLAANKIGDTNGTAAVEQDANKKNEFTITAGSAKVAMQLSFNLHVGADADMTNKIGVDIETMNSDYLGIKGISIADDTGKSATYAIDAIADAIQKVSDQRSALGAVQNRLEHTIKNLDNVVENTTAAESQIRDTDMASTMVEYTKNNILQQAGQSMLAQANQSTQGVLSLLG